MIFLAVLSAQPFLYTVDTMALAYGESTYNGGVYNDSTTTPATDQSASPDAPKGSAAANSNSANPDKESVHQSQSSALSTEDSESNQDHLKSTGDKVSDNNKTPADDSHDSPASEQNNDSSRRSGLMWVSIGALGIAFLLIVITLVAKKRHQA